MMYCTTFTVLRLLRSMMYSRGGDGGARGGMHDGAAAVRFRRTLLDGVEFVRTAEDRVDLDRSHHVSFRIFNQK